jgi:hypothetical protein
MDFEAFFQPDLATFPAKYVLFIITTGRISKLRGE